MGRSGSPEFRGAPTAAVAGQGTLLELDEEGMNVLRSSHRAVLAAIRAGRTTPIEIGEDVGLPPSHVARLLQDLATVYGAPSVAVFVAAARSYRLDSPGVVQARMRRTDLRKRQTDLRAEIQRKRKGGPPSLVGDKFEPDPERAATQEEFVALLRTFWAWAGQYSVRDLAAWSDGAFSRTTVADLLAKAPRKRPPVTLPYVRGLIRACGGQDDRVQRWTTAWRRLYLPSASTDGTGEVITLPNRAANG